MKTFKVKNYKGNLVESLKRFSDSHKDMKIVEACEKDGNLEIKTEKTEKIEETDKIKDFVSYFLEDPNAKEAIDIIQKASALLLLFYSFRDDSHFEGILRDLDSLFSIGVAADLDKTDHPERSEIYDNIVKRMNGYKNKIRQNLQKFAKTNGKNISKNIWKNLAIDD